MRRKKKEGMNRCTIFRDFVYFSLGGKRDWKTEERDGRESRCMCLLSLSLLMMFIESCRFYYCLVFCRKNL